MLGVWRLIGILRNGDSEYRGTLHSSEMVWRLHSKAAAFFGPVV